ncbi:putative dipeptidylpeptidase III [Xylaria castorea]|nr:putative dipeptidylpeptidase III [Xylaria castorea]
MNTFFAERNADIYSLEIRVHYDALSDKQKLYAHWMSRAAFEGTRIILRQNAAKAETIFDLIVALHHHCDGDWKALGHSAGVTDAEIQYFLEYSSMFLTNLGNYAAFNKQKFFPRIQRTAFAALVSQVPEGATLFGEALDAVYSGTNPSLGYPNVDLERFSNYYPGSKILTKEEVTDVQRILESESICTDNTRLRTTRLLDGSLSYTVLVTSAETSTEKAMELNTTIQTHGQTQPSLGVAKGDHSDCMRRIIDCLENAEQFAANSVQSQMLEAHQEAFRSGEMSSQKLAQVLWVQDKSPKVEALLGFLEYYRDPHGVRAEWRGFVLIENQPQTRLFENLIENSQTVILSLPWNDHGRSPFETDEYEVPGFVSMEALAFVSTSIPAGTNVPNHADIRAEHGYKNFAIRNRVIDAPPGKVSFLSEEDSQLYTKLSSRAFGMLVALHELFGHGSGKHLREISPGEFNFDINDPPRSPLSGTPVGSWYRPGQTFKSMFGWSYEECRCELVGLFLSLVPEAAVLFSEPDSDDSIDDIIDVMFLYVMRQGILGLLAWNPTTKIWGSAHTRARYVITTVLLQEGIGSIEFIGPDRMDLEISLDRSKLRLEGRTILGQLLKRLHVYVCTADEAGVELYDDLSVVGAEMQEYRVIVERSAATHKQLVQANTFVDNGVAFLREYDPTPAGMIRSWAEREV